MSFFLNNTILKNLKVKKYISKQKSIFAKKITQLKSSLMSRLLLFFASLMLFVWVMTALITWFEGKEYINSFFDTQQILFAKNLASMHFDPSIIQLPDTKDVIGSDKRNGDEDDDVLAFAIFSLSGELLLSDSDNGKDFPFTLFDINTQGFINTLLYDDDFDDDDDDVWRIFYLKSLDGQRIIAVGQEEEYRDDMTLDILLGQLLPWIISLPFLIIGLAWLLYRELSPLRKITKTLLIRTPDNTNPINLENVALEIQPLIQELNALFVRTGELLQKERSFVANAAHELRTPLAGLHVQAEVIAMCDDDVKARTHAINKLSLGIQRCTRLIEQLLLLSSLEAKHVKNKTKNEAVFFETLIPMLIQETKPSAHKENIEITTSLKPRQKPYFGYSELWAIALRNLLDNAMRHSKKHAQIHIVLYENILYIENSAVPISKEILPLLGQRFYRPPGQNTCGTGLGLAIIEHICELHSAKFIIDNCFQEEQKSYLPKELHLSVNGVIACIILE